MGEKVGPTSSVIGVADCQSITRDAKLGLSMRTLHGAAHLRVERPLASVVPSCLPDEASRICAPWIGAPVWSMTWPVTCPVVWPASEFVVCVAGRAFMPRGPVRNTSAQKIAVSQTLTGAGIGFDTLTRRASIASAIGRLILLLAG